VEIWDNGWHFTGADEYDKDGLNRGWFLDNAAKANADVPRHGIYATSWQKSGLSFPMVWAQNSNQVAAVNVTSRYATGSDANADTAQLRLRLLKAPGANERLVAKVEVLNADGEVLAEALTKAGTADLNDMPRISLMPGTTGSLRFTVGEESRSTPLPAIAAGELIHDAVWSTMSAAPKLAAPTVTPALAAIREWLALPVAERKADSPALAAALTRAEAALVTEVFAKELLARLAIERKAEMDAKVITMGDKKMPWLEKSFGSAPAGGASLWISMHGGGGAPKEVNDEQWQNQIQLYQPSEGIYLAPRAPTDNWNLWHEDHIDPMFQRLIENFVALRGVNPNKVYLMGYSAGGDGVWQLAPRMADRFAAAAMMAGHPNEASLLGLRNLPFAIFMGGADSAYKRNTIAAERTAQLGELEKADPGAYVHLSRIYPGVGHWMNLRDAESLPWMAKFQRNPWPKKIVWLQDDVTHERFYWLKIPDKAAAMAEEKILASIEGQTVTLDGSLPAKMELRLADALLDLDQPVKVVVNGKEVSNNVVARTAGTIWRTLQERADAQASGSALLVLP
jgi:dienelactone hydrolase